ncbi:MAG: hypothetical protein ACI841_004473 [Planctomycetota bacterium]|jgi:hypothetical protein
MTQLRFGFLIFPILLLSLAFTNTAIANSQKVGSKYHEDPENGYRFKPLKDFEGVPIPPDQRGSGLIGKMSGKSQIIKIEDGGVASLGTDLVVYAMMNPEIKEVEKGHTSGKRARPDVMTIIGKQYRGLDNIRSKPEVDERLEIKKVEVHHRVFRPDAGQFEMIVDVWSFNLEHADVCLVYVFSADKDKKWLAATKKSAKTFSLIDRVLAEVAAPGEKQTYDQLMVSAEAEAARTEGWRAVPTPSERFIILTSAEKKSFVDTVIKRLEISRDVFEKDFPPPPNFNAVSIVRLCGSEEEFHTYGDTGGGVAGWFNPRTTELVLYDAVNTNRNMSFAVMSHEAFHQYCHFLFGQSEAHRWFDEGHGDYYGGIKITGKKAKIERQMPAGLDRLRVIQEMVRKHTYRPLEKHINYTHGQWQSYGVPSYAQSWSIIYFLRQGALRKVRGKMWKKEYANILPAYVETLSGGFAAEYDKIRAKHQKKADKEGRELTDAERTPTRKDLPSDAKDRIWKAAMEASWGQIDIDQFEADWIEYVDDEL